MNKKYLNILLGFIFFVLTYFITHPFSNRPSSNNVLSGTSSGCDASLWKHIYHPQRLQVLDTCKTVTGIIQSVKAEPDGDYHIRLRLDSQFANLINQENIDKQHGDLVLEPICEHPVTQEDAIAACSGFAGNITSPTVGSHVQVIGSYVLDTEHGWMEIHPVTSMLAN